MGPKKSPWIEVPDDWLDAEYDKDPEYEKIQTYFGLKVKRQVINEYLLGEGKNHIGETIKVQSIKADINSDNNLNISSILTCQSRDKSGKMITGGGRISRTFNGKDKEVNFDLMLPDDYKTKPFPKGYSYLYYRKAVPLLRKLQYATIKTHAYSNGDDMRGAAQWSLFGYSLDPDPQYNYPWSANSKIFDKFLTWLEDSRETDVTDEVRRDIQDLKFAGRMRGLYEYSYTDKDGIIHNGKDYLEGKSGKTLQRTQTVDWFGIIPDINNESTVEMDELIRTLIPPKHIK